MDIKGYKTYGVPMLNPNLIARIVVLPEQKLTFWQRFKKWIERWK